MSRAIAASESTDANGDDIVEAVYRDNFAALVRIAYLLTGSAAAAEDAVHDAFLRCVPRLGDLDHPPSYLRAAVVNECRAVHRRGSRTTTAPVPDEEDHLPHELVETRDALARLDPRSRAAVVLRYFVDIPDPEIAEILGCRPATVRTILHRAMKQLREELT